MVRSLAALSAFLGKPSCHTLVGAERNPARIGAHWSCGCVASGVTAASLALTPCVLHRPSSVATAAAFPPANVPV